MRDDRLTDETREALRARVLRAARDELEARPHLRTWRGQAAANGLVSLAVGIVAWVAAAGAMIPEDGLQRAVAGGLVGLVVVLGWVGLAPNARVLGRVAVGVVALAASSLPLVARGGEPASAGLMCAAAVFMLALLPLGLGLAALRDAAPSWWRALLVGAAAGGVGEAVLATHCMPSVEHVALFHVLPWCAVMLVAVLVQRALPVRSYAP